MDTTSYPLQELHLEILNNVLRNGPVVLDSLKKMQACGPNCQLRIDAIQAQVDMAARFKQQFFPDAI